MGSIPAASESTHNGFRLACPACGGSLDIGHAAARCTLCHKEYLCQDSIWRLLSSGRDEYYESFLSQYRAIRRDQGWGRLSAEYYRSLPEVEPTDPQRAIWSMRKRHYRAFIERVLEPLERLRREPLTICDLGAGNGWLSHRLSQRGHCVAAVDINPDVHDGLGACAYYESRFPAIQAEYDRLPLEPAQADLVVFGGSFHYSCDCQTSLEEAFRVLKADGQLVILDSPFYHRPSSGERMVAERRAGFVQRYGMASDSLPSEGFLTWRGMADLSRHMGFSWTAIWPVQSWRRACRRMFAGLRVRREAARFPVVVVKPYPVWEMSLPQRLLRRVWTPILRRNYRLAIQRPGQHPPVERVDGRPILVFPGVFNPRLFGTGEYLARQLDERLIPPGCSVLDMGTGTGIAAVFAAQWARRVVAVDILPEAVRCAQANFRLNHVDGRAEARQGDLFSAIGEEHFDVVLFNPPFLRGTPKADWERAFYSTNIAQRFAEGLPDHLNPGGRALLLLSSLGESGAYLQALRWRGFRVQVLAEHDRITERLALYQVNAGPEWNIAQSRAIRNGAAE